MVGESGEVGKLNALVCSLFLYPAPRRLQRALPVMR